MLFVCLCCLSLQASVAPGAGTRGLDAEVTDAGSGDEGGDAPGPLPVGLATGAPGASPYGW